MGTLSTDIKSCQQPDQTVEASSSIPGWRRRRSARVLPGIVKRLIRGQIQTGPAIDLLDLRMLCWTPWRNGLTAGHLDICLMCLLFCAFKPDAIECSLTGSRKQLLHL